MTVSTELQAPEVVDVTILKRITRTVSPYQVQNRSRNSVGASGKPKSLQTLLKQ